MMRRSRRRFYESREEVAPLVRRHAHRLVPGRELDPLPFHFGLVAHDHHEMCPFLGRPEYAPDSRRPLPVALSQPPFGRRLLSVSVDVRQHHGWLSMCWWLVACPRPVWRRRKTVAWRNPRVYVFRAPGNESASLSVDGGDEKRRFKNIFPNGEKKLINCSVFARTTTARRRLLLGVRWRFWIWNSVGWITVARALDCVVRSR